MSSALLNRTHPLATLAVSALSVATAISACRLYNGWTYLAPMLTVVGLGHLVAVLLRVAKVPSLVAIPLAIAAVFAIAAVVYHRDLAAARMIPTGRSFTALRDDLRFVSDNFATTVAPIASTGPFATAAGLTVAMCAPLADTFAFRAYGRAEAVVPTLVVFVLLAATGADRNRIPVAAAWIGTALATTAILRAVHRRDQEPWIGGRRPRLIGAIPAAVTLGVVAAVAAGLIAGHLPGAGAKSLLDTRHRRSTTTQIVSPLVEVRGQLVNQSNVKLFTVTADQPAYWRLMGVAAFDGDTWAPSPESLRDAAGRRLSDGSGRAVEQTITISGLRGKLIPAAYLPASVSSDVEVVWAGQSQTLLTNGDASLASGDTFTVQSMLVEPTPEQLRTATSDNAPAAIFLQLPNNFPDRVRTLAAEITAGGDSGYERALAIQNYFRNNFTYSLDVPRGHSDQAILDFLGRRSGYCEQFAATFAAMARSVGLPARVAVGFTPGDRDDDGRFVVRGRNAHAWPEVWFDGIGWVAFEPTPGRGAPGSEDITGVEPQQDGQSTPPTDPPAPTDPPPPTADSVVPSANTPTATTPPPTVPPNQLSTDDHGSAWWAWLLLGAAALGMYAWLMPSVVRRRRRPSNQAAPERRVVAAWHEAQRALAATGHGVRLGDSALETAAASASAPVDQQALAELAEVVTEAVYSGDAIGSERAGRSEALGATIARSAHRSRTRRQRVIARVNPRRVL